MTPLKRWCLTRTSSHYRGVVANVARVRRPGAERRPDRFGAPGEKLRGQRAGAAPATGAPNRQTVRGIDLM